MSELAVRPVVTDDLQRSRVTVFFRILLALPHLIVLGVAIAIALLISPVVWLIVLVGGSLPAGLHDAYGRLMRYWVHVQAYLWLGAEPWPSFMAGRAYPIDVTVPARDEHQNRWTVAFRLILALPALLLASALGSGVEGLGAASYHLGAAATVGFLAWFACLARGQMPGGMRDLVAYALGYGAQAFAYLLFVSPRYPSSDPARLGVIALPEHPVRLELTDRGLHRDRLLVFFRLLLALPHFIWLTLWSIAAFFAVVAAWLAALATGRVPDGLHRFLAARLRYEAHVYGFVFLVADPFPGFVGAPGSYPVELELPAPVLQSRWTVFFRIFLALPALLITSALGGVRTVAGVMGWFASLFTAQMPDGLRNLLAYTIRYQEQVGAYVSLVTERYPYSGPGPCDR